MTHINIAAWTPPTGMYPPYISVNKDGDWVIVHTRDAVDQHHSTFSMTLDEWNAFRKQIIDFGEV